MKGVFLSLAALAVLGFSTAAPVQAAAPHSGHGSAHHVAHRGARTHGRVVHRGVRNRGRVLHRGYRNWSRVRWSTRYGCNVYYTTSTNRWYRFNTACGCYVPVAMVRR